MKILFSTEALETTELTSLLDIALKWGQDSRAQLFWKKRSTTEYTQMSTFESIVTIPDPHPDSKISVDRQSKTKWYQNYFYQIIMKTSRKSMDSPVWNTCPEKIRRPFHQLLGCPKWTCWPQHQPHSQSGEVEPLGCSFQSNYQTHCTVSENMVFRIQLYPSGGR